jgi:ABC-type Fe3+/spermidine/putrescine transport system ATPase subunit
MQRGSVEQIGPPEVVYQWPASPFVARFLGMSNLLPGQIVDAAAGRVKTPLGELQTAHVTPLRDTRHVTVLLRPEAARLADGTEQVINPLRGRVVARSFRGAYYRLVVRHASGIELAFEMERKADRTPSIGDEVALSLQPQAINLLSVEPDTFEEATQPK